jgi:hypothetical protein
MLYSQRANQPFARYFVIHRNQWSGYGLDEPPCCIVDSDWGIVKSDMDGDELIVTMSELADALDVAREMAAAAEIAAGRLAASQSGTRRRTTMVKS